MANCPLICFAVECMVLALGPHAVDWTKSSLQYTRQRQSRIEIGLVTGGMHCNTLFKFVKCTACTWMCNPPNNQEILLIKVVLFYIVVTQ